MARLVVLSTRPGVRFVAELERAWAAGDAVLPVDPRRPQAERDRTLAAARAERPVDDGVALVVPTSGTTGEPKPVELTHDALDAAADASLARLQAGPGDRWLCCVPLARIAGLAILARSRRGGTSPVVVDDFDPRALDRATETTFVSLVPTMVKRALDAAADLGRFRAVLVGGDRLAAPLAARARSAGARIVRTYGMTETCGGIVYDGRPLDGVSMRIVEGEIHLRGPMLMRGYRGRPDLTSRALRDGWYATGDLGEIDDSGSLRVFGRSDDVIVTGGEKVSPVEVETALLSHPDVADALVFGVADAEWGSRVVAAIVPAGALAPSVEAIRASLGGSLAAYKLPTRIVSVAEIPAGRDRATAAARYAEVGPQQYR